MPDPTPAPASTPAPEEKPRCRAITTDGHRCKSGALYEGHLCWPHFHHRHPVLPDPTHVSIPLLEDHASIQLVLSQVAHGLLTHKLDSERARALIYTCQVANATLPRPPRMPSPQPTQPTPDPSQRRPDEEDDDDQVYRLALDYQGPISADGDLPAPNAHWQPPSPDATPWDLIDAAPNQSKPTPRSPWDPDAHCSCAICTELLKLEADPRSHPHLQPVVNPYCRQNRPGCQGPASSSRCHYCESLYKCDPDKYDRPRRRNPRPSERSEASRPNPAAGLSGVAPAHALRAARNPSPSPTPSPTSSPITTP